jgi:hypothetical protein
VTVKLEPVALSVAGRLSVAPAATLPKLKLVGLMETWPTAVPLPDREMAGLAPDESEASATLPTDKPAVGGANVTLKVKLCPAGRVNGKLRPLILKPVPVELASDTVTLDSPELVRVAGKV